MLVLVVGSGAREHAIVRALCRDPEVDAVHAAPGNPGIAGLATCHDVAAGGSDPAAVTDLALRLGVDLVVVGPEAPLVAGVANAVRAAGLECFGPSAEAARLEASKAFAKEVMAATGVPTARARVCADEAGVEAALTEYGSPYVVKDDGLAAGKGVVVTPAHDEALGHARRCLAGGGRVVVEEYLDGPEVSLFCLSDGTTIVPLQPAQDFKRLRAGDDGPNTGGMGAYSPLEWTPAGLVDDVVATVAQPTIDEMARRGAPFVGVLYVGLALTPRGPRVVEFNARFGDPETQVVLARLATPLGSLLRAAARGSLAGLAPLRWRKEAAVTVVLAAAGYPAAPRTGDVITGLEAPCGATRPTSEAAGPEGAVVGDAPDGSDAPGPLEAAGESYVLHAGTRLVDGELRTAGGRVLSVVATGADLAAARERAYAAADLVTFDGAQRRDDIALAAQQGRVVSLDETSLR